MKLDLDETEKNNDAFIQIEPMMSESKIGRTKLHQDINTCGSPEEPKQRS